MQMEDLMLVIVGCSVLIFGGILLYIRTTKDW
jgi:hypothetical protein